MMPFNFISLFLALVLGSTESGPQSESAAPCLDTLVPGVIRMSRGVDISKIDLFPSETNAPNGFRRQLFAFTCSQNSRWHHSFDESTRYSRPDQLETIDEISSTSRQISLQFESSQRGVKASLAAAVEVDVDFVRGGFSASGAYNSARSMILESSRSVHTKSFSVAGTQLFLSSPSKLSLSAGFKDMLSTLPVTYETEPAPYDELVEEFGTHYFVNARFGGSIFFKSFIDNTYLYSSSESSLRAQLEAKFVFLTGKLTGLANSTMVNEKFQTAAQVDFQVYGGQYIPGQSSNVSHRGRWQKSAIKSPWLVGGKLQSIERLIANESVRQEVKKAIAWKLLRAYAEDLKATLKLSHVRLPEHQQQQWKDIQENLKKAKSTSKGDVNQMKDQLSEMFLTHQEMMDLRLLAGFATQLLDLLTDSFLEARLHRMVHSCASEAQEKRLKTEGELFRSLQEELLRLNSSSTRPDTDLINQFGRKILPFAIKHEQIDGFCAENKQCQKCAQVKLGYTKNWSFYVQFYLNKLYEFKKEALNCKADCKVDFEKISARFDEVYGKLDDAFQKENRPLKSKLQEWVKEVYSILALARNESFLFLYLL